MRTAPAGWPALRPGGACSAFPPATRRQVAKAWQPVAQVYQSALGLVVGVTSSISTFLPVAAPFAALAILLNALPYIVVELMIDCSVSGQVKRQAGLARQSVDVVLGAPQLPIPGLSEVRRALQTARPFLVAAEAGKLPSASEVAALVKTAGILDAIPDEVVGGIFGAIEFVTGKASSGNASSLLSSLTRLSNSGDDEDASALKARQKAEAFAVAKAKAKAAAVEKAKELAKAKAIEEAKAKAKAAALEKAKAQNAGATGTVGKPAVVASSGPSLPLLAVGGIGAALIVRAMRGRRGGAR